MGGVLIDKTKIGMRHAPLNGAKDSVAETQTVTIRVLTTLGVCTPGQTTATERCQLTILARCTFNCRLSQAH